MVKIFLISRYLSDLFYMAPIYHQAFTKLDKLLVVDSTDLTFVSDIKVPVREAFIYVLAEFVR